MDNREILTVGQVADVVQLSSKTVLRAIAAGHLEASRLGQGRAGWRLKRDAVDRWMGREVMRRHVLRRASPPLCRRPVHREMWNCASQGA